MMEERRLVLIRNKELPGEIREANAYARAPILSSGFRIPL